MLQYVSVSSDARRVWHPIWVAMACLRRWLPGATLVFVGSSAEGGGKEQLCGGCVPATRGIPTVCVNAPARKVVGSSTKFQPTPL